MAATGPLTKPTHVGQTVIFRSKKYTCIKKGKSLVWDKGVAVKANSATSSPTISSSSALTFVVKSSEVAEGSTKVVQVSPSGAASFSVAVTRASGAVVVLNAACTHRGCIVEATKSELVCPCHGSSFNLSNGAVNQGPASAGLRKYVASEDAGSIYIKI